MPVWIIAASLFGLGLAAPGSPPSQRAVPEIRYVVRVDSANLSGWEVELTLRGVPDSFRVAMAAHPEYDDKFWRQLVQLRGESPGGPVRIERQDSAVWAVAARGGQVTLRYRIQLPPPEGPPRAAWRPFLTPTGGLFGGPHSFLYLLGAEASAAEVTLELPRSWDVATGLAALGTPARATSLARWRFRASDAAVLMEAPIFAGRFSSWRFTVDSVPHRVVYWSAPGAARFDSVAFVDGLQRLVRQAVRLFGRMPYRDYTFVFQDAAYGGLEHPNSVTLGLPAAELAANPHAGLRETAHEFVHTWNLMQLRPVEYRSIDYRTQPPVAGLWFSEGLTLFYADLLLRRARLPVPDSTRIAHLEGLIGWYLANPGNAHHSAEAVSRVAYNAPPGSLGDYSASSHLQGELLGTVLDLVVREATGGARSFDDVMRLLLQRFGDPARPGFQGRDVEQAVETVCGCEVTALFDAHVRSGGRPLDFDRYLAAVGLRTRVSWAPAERNGQPDRDLRIWAWLPPGAPGPRLVVMHPASSWARAGFHSGDELVAVDGVPVTTWPDFRARLVQAQIGDTLRLTVRRPSGPYSATVRMAGFERPTVRLEEVPGATERQRALRARWLNGS